MKKTFKQVIAADWALEYRTRQMGWQHFLACVLSYSVYFVAPFWMAAFLILAWSGVNQPAASVTIVIALFGIAWIVRYCFLSFRSRKQWNDWIKKHEGETIVTTLTDEELEVETDERFARCKWDELTEIECYSTYWQLKFGDTIVLLPLQYVDSQIEHHLKDLVLERKIKVNVMKTLFPAAAELPHIE